MKSSSQKDNSTIRYNFTSELLMNLTEVKDASVF